jgi:transposase
MDRGGNRKNRGKGGGRLLPVMHADAAGIDVGAEEVFVAIPVERAAEPVRSFGTFTQDLYDLANWLQACNICTVAMESTGVYWIP